MPLVLRSLLTFEQVLEIKKLLWEGVRRQKDIAEQFNVTQATISHIFRGQQWEEVPWPNGEKGSVSEERYTLLLKSKRRGARYSSERGQSVPSTEAMEAAKKVETLINSEDSSDGDNRFLRIIKGGKRNNKKLLSWSSILEKDPGNSLVREVEESSDSNGKLAIRIVYSEVPEKEWQTKQTRELVQTTIKRIKEHEIV